MTRLCVGIVKSKNMGLPLMGKSYIFILITDNDVVVFTPLMTHNVQLICKIKDGTCYTCLESLTL